MSYDDIVLATMEILGMNRPNDGLRLPTMGPKQFPVLIREQIE